MEECRKNEKLVWILYRLTSDSAESALLCKLSEGVFVVGAFRCDHLVCLVRTPVAFIAFFTSNARGWIRLLPSMRIPSLRFKYPRVRPLTLFARCIILMALEVLVNALFWVVSAIVFTRIPDGGYRLLGLALIAWTTGLRHGLDADHISGMSRW